MASQLDNRAPIGSLFKKPRPRTRPLDMGRNPRELDPHYLSLVRMLPCCVRGCKTEPVQAHHIRKPSAAHGKPATPMGSKPDDKWCLPLCRKHHEEAHTGELSFWCDLDISPVQLCVELYAARHSLDAMRQIILGARTGV